MMAERRVITVRVPARWIRWPNAVFSRTMIEPLVGRHEGYHISDFPSPKEEPGSCPQPHAISRVSPAGISTVTLRLCNRIEKSIIVCFFVSRITCINERYKLAPALSPAREPHQYQ